MFLVFFVILMVFGLLFEKWKFKKNNVYFKRYLEIQKAKRKARRKQFFVKIYKFMSYIKKK